MYAAMRSIDLYCPFADLASRYPGWNIQLMADLPAKIGEVFLPQERTLLLSKTKHDTDPQLVVAHAVAHLDLHQIGGPFTLVQEQEATMLAEWRLDRVCDRSEVA